MFKARTTAILTAVALFLSLWWVVVERPKMLGKVYPGRIFPTLTTGDITQVEIVKHHQRGQGTTGEERIVLKRGEGENWSLAHPVPYPASRGAVDTLLGAIVFLESQVVLENAEGAFPKTGPRFFVRAFAGGKTWTVEVGNRHPVEPLNYYRAGSKLFLAPEALRRCCQWSVYRWRDKSVCPLSPSYVGELSLRRSDGAELLLQRAEHDIWFVRKPRYARADSSKVVALLDGINTLKVKRFYNDGGTAEPAQFGLAEPAWRVKVTSINKQEEYEILLSAPIPKSDPQEIYARRVDRPQIFLCEDTATALLTVQIDRLRDLRALPFKDYGWVKEVRVRGMGADFSLLRSTKEGPWAGVERSGPGARTGVKKFSSSSERAERLLDEIAGLRMGAFRSGASIGEEQFRITLHVEGLTEPMELVLGRSLGENRYLARRKGVQGEEDEPFEIFTSLPRRIQELGALLYRNPAIVGRIPDRQFLHFELISRKGRWLLLRFALWEVDGWRGVAVDQELVQKAAAIVQEPKAAFYEPNAGSFSALGLDRAGARLRVKLYKGFGTFPYHELFVGKQVDPPQAMSYARVDTEPVVFIFDPTPLFELAEHLAEVCTAEKKDQ